MQYLGFNKNKSIPNLIVIIITFVVLNSSLSISFPIGDLYFIILLGMFFLIFIYILNEKKKINLSMVLLLIACLTSILINDVPIYFRAYTRFLLFAAIIFIVGPLVLTSNFKKFRFKIFNLMNKLNIIICLLSFLGLVTGIYRGITLTEYGTKRVDFTGLFNHSMTLGPMAGIAILTSFYYFKKEQNKKKQLYLIVVMFLLFLTVITSGSRGALVATILGSLYYLYSINRGKLKRYFRIVLLIIFVITATFPLWKERADFLMSKMNRDEGNDLYDSRTVKWEQRLYEFKSSPVFGIGFASINPHMKDEFMESTGAVEPGSSWLGILSMTGLFGFIPMIFLFLRDLYYLYKFNKIYSGYLGGLLILVSVHMIVEGYIFAAGAFLFFYVWLLLGVIEGFIEVEKSNRKMI